MGIRVYAYAVDLPKFDAFLESPLADLLWRYQREGRDAAEQLKFTVGKGPDVFFTTPGGPIQARMEASGRELELLDEDRLRTIPALQSSGRQHLSSGTIYQAEWLLGAFSNCKGIDFIERLINGHRRWWVGSVLQFSCSALPNKDYQQLEVLFRKVLRGLNCGWVIPETDIGVNTVGLPFTPDSDPDCRFGRWDKDDVFAVATLLSKVTALSPTFIPPPGPIGIAPDEGDWHEWVHENVTALARIPNLGYAVCNLLTFIG